VAFLADMYSFLDPSKKLVIFSLHLRTPLWCDEIFVDAAVAFLLRRESMDGVFEHCPGLQGHRKNKILFQYG